MNTEHLIWQAISIGVVAGVPLSLMGELLLAANRDGSAWLCVVGLLLAAPAAAYSAVTGDSVFAGTATTLTYFILQIVYCIVVTFFLLLLFQQASRRFVALCAKVKMRRINKTIFALMGGVVFYGFFPQGAHACSVSLDSLFVGDPNMVWMVDGKDRDATVTIRAWLDSPDRAAYDFGFMSGNAYVPITGKTHNVGAYTFAGGVPVDFALRTIGTDGVFGTPDDGIYRLSDAVSHASQRYFARIDPTSARNPTVENVYYRYLLLNWDLNQDGRSDARVLLETVASRYDGMSPAIAAVPQPTAVWLFASGLLGLVGAARVVTTASTRNDLQDNEGLPSTTFRTIHAVIKHNPKTQVSNH